MKNQSRQRKPVKLLICGACGDVYMKIGGDNASDIRLAHPRKVPPLPLTGGEPQGTCPKHERVRGVA